MKRGFAVLGVLGFLFTESLECIGNRNSIQYFRATCAHVVFNLMGLFAIGSAFTFEVIVIDTGIASHHDILSFDADLPLLVRVAGFNVVWSLFQATILWGGRRNIPLYRTDSVGEMQPITANALLCFAPIISWSVIQPVLYYRLRALFEESEKRWKASGYYDSEHSIFYGNLYLAIDLNLTRWYGDAQANRMRYRW
jgi:hypothetical protein